VHAVDVLPCGRKYPLQAKMADLTSTLEVMIINIKETNFNSAYQMLISWCNGKVSSSYHAQLTASSMN
jgi:hypothetical protein